MVIQFPNYKEICNMRNLNESSRAVYESVEQDIFL